MKTHLYYNPSGLRHDTGPGHPESPARLQTALDVFAQSPFKDWPRFTARPADYDDILRAHDENYVYSLEDALPDHGRAALDNDTILSPASLQAALDAAGAVCAAVTAVMNDETRRAFCAVRPPGHHAGPRNAEGFCLFNNAMIGALFAQAATAARRIAIVDFDVHHGNGTDAMTRLHPDIFYASTHEWPLYPGTGGPGTDLPGRIVNRPLAAGSPPAAFRAAYENDILPQLEQFAPNLLIISAGFDAHRDDPLANLNLTAEDFAWITAQLCEIANRACAGRVVSVLEGGYNLPALRDSLTAHLLALDAA